MNEPETTTLQHYVAVLWRRRVALVVPIVVLAVAGYVSAHRQQPVYRASSQVLLNHQDQVATSIVGVQTPIADPGRYAQTQTLVAWTPAVAGRVLAAVGDPTGNVKDLLQHTSIYPDADVLVFSVTAHDPRSAVRLAGAWARSFTAYRRLLDTRDLARTLAQLDARLAALGGKTGADARLAATLAAKALDVQLLEALRRANVYVVQTPALDDADKIAPRPLRTTAIAIAVGILLGLVLALLLEGLDSRVRSASELEDALSIPLLGRLALRDEHALAEAAMTLRARLAAGGGGASGVLLVGGAVVGDGSAEVASVLARASARAGRRVVLADADFRSSPLDRLFDGETADGTAALAAGEAEPETTLRRIPLESRGGELNVIGVGAKPRDAGALAASPALATALQALRTHADEVVVLVPPLAAVGDALVLAPGADATLLVLPSTGVRRRDLQTLARLLGDWPTRLPGFVLVEGATGRRLSGRLRTTAAARNGEPDQAAARAAGSLR